MRGKRIQIPLKVGHHRPDSENAIEMTFRWRAGDCWLGSFVNFQEIRTSIAKKPYIFYLSGVWDPDLCPPLDPYIRTWQMYTAKG